MNDTLLMGVSQSIGKLAKDGDRLSRVHHFALILQLIETMFESAPIYQLHHNIEVTVLLICIVDSHDIRMRESGHQAGFQVETLDKTAISRIPRRENLHCYIAAQGLLVGFIDPCHSPLTDYFKDAVIAVRCSNQSVLFHRSVEPRMLSL